MIRSVFPDISKSGFSVLVYVHGFPSACAHESVAICWPTVRDHCVSVAVPERFIAVGAERLDARVRNDTGVVVFGVSIFVAPLYVL